MTDVSELVKRLRFIVGEDAREHLTIHEAATTLLALVAELEEYRDANELLNAEVAECEESFALYHSAEQRAIKAWQEANPGSDLVWPDKGKLTIWLQAQLTEAQMDARRYQYLRGKWFKDGGDLCVELDSAYLNYAGGDLYTIADAAIDKAQEGEK